MKINIKTFLVVIFLIFVSCKKSKPHTSFNENVLEKDIVSFENVLENEDTSIIKKNIASDSLLNLLIKSKNDTIKRKRLVKLLVFNVINGRNEGFKITYEELLKASKEAKDTLNIANSYRYKAGYFRNISVYDSSLYYYVKAEALYKKIGDKYNIANILLNKSIVQYNINDLLRAELSISKSYNLCKDLNDKILLFQVYTTFGNISCDLKEFNKALDYHNRALNLTIENNLNPNYPQIAICQNNIGNTLKNSGRYKESIPHFVEGLKNKSINKDQELKVLLYDNLGHSKIKIKSYSQLPGLFYKALKISDSLNYVSNKIYIYCHLSEYFLTQNDTLMAIRYGEKALKLSKKSKIPPGIVLSLQQLSTINGDYAKKYSLEYYRVNDSLQIAERKLIDRFARIELETDELRQEKSVLEERNRNILSYLLGTIVIGGFLFFIRIQRSRQRELALKQSQQQANEEIYRLIISHQNQLEEGRDLEKKRISKELHDGVLGRLFGLRLNLEGLNNFDDTDAKQTRQEYLNELKVIEQDLREISHELNRENLVLINNFEAIINNHLDQQAKNYKPKLTAHLSDKINWEILPNTTKINLYRILQEALQNINKHAEAKHISVQFVKDAKGNLLFTIEDDGKGYNTNSKRSMGIGLSNIVERVHQCEGKIDIRSQLGKGTKIMITFPLENDTINM